MQKVGQQGVAGGHGGNETSFTFTVYGTDEYGAALVETITGPNNSTAYGLKAFKKVTRVAVSGDSGAVEIGTADRLGLPSAIKSVSQVIAEYKNGVRYFSELTNMTVLTEEVGELARIMARKYGDQSFKEGEKCNLADEMADVLWVLVCLANQTGVDLTAAVEANFAKKTSRDKERHLHNPKL